MIIRKANTKDFRKMAEIMKKEFNKPPYNEKWTIETATRTIKTYYGRGLIYVALIENKIVGLIIMKIDPYNLGITIMIEELVVDSDFQNRGIGKALVNKLEQECKKRKIKYIHLSTSKKAPAFKFYKKLGYIPSKYTVFMRKELK